MFFKSEYCDFPQFAHLSVFTHSIQITVAQF